MVNKQQRTAQSIAIDKMDAPVYKNGKGHMTIAVIGERRCGKTSMVLAANDQILPRPDERIPSKTFIVDVEVDGKTEKCLVFEGDISLQDEPDVGSELYSESDVVVLIFAEEKRCDDLKNVVKWYEKLRSQVPVLLVRIIKKPPRVGSLEESDLHYRPWGFPAYILCFPHRMEGVKYAFQEAVKIARKSII